MPESTATTRQIDAAYSTTRGESTNVATMCPAPGVAHQTVLLDQVTAESSTLGCGWWRTHTADSIIDVAAMAPLVVALAGIAVALGEGGDPDVLVGGADATAAFRVAQEWINAGVDAVDVVDWLRAECWDPKAAAHLAAAGVRPASLLDELGRPTHVVVGPADEPWPLARAVAEQHVTIEHAVAMVNKR